MLSHNLASSHGGQLQLIRNGECRSLESASKKASKTVEHAVSCRTPALAAHFTAMYLRTPFPSGAHHGRFIMKGKAKEKTDVLTDVARLPTDIGGGWVWLKSEPLPIRQKYLQPPSYVLSTKQLDLAWSTRLNDRAKRQKLKVWTAFTNNSTSR